VCWKPRSSCWSSQLHREEFLSAPIHSPPPLSGSPYRSFSRPYKSGWHSVAELTLALPHSGRDGLTRRVGGTALGRDSQACERRGADSSLTLAPASVRALNPPVGGPDTGGRAREALERGRTAPEGATDPRATRNLTRGGDRPSSEAEPHPRGRPTLARGGTSPEGATGPRARREFASAVSCPSSEAEFRQRVAGPTVWWAAGATRSMGPTVGL
jgi:hypothetical protein